MDQRLSLTLSFGEIPWFGVRGEIQRYDWSKTRFLYVPSMNFQAMGTFKPITALYFRPHIKPRNVAKQQCERQWMTPSTLHPSLLTRNPSALDLPSSPFCLYPLLFTL